MVRCSLCRRDRSQGLLFREGGCPRCEDPLPAPLTPLERAELERLTREEEAAFQASLAPLRALGRPVRVGLVGCGKTKRTFRSRARELYTGNLFRAALRYAERACDKVFILSALHGLVELDRELDPYDLKLSDWRRDLRPHWGHQVVGELEAALPALDLDIQVLAGADYALALPNPHPPGAGHACRWLISAPLEGLGVGHRLRYFKLAQANGPGKIGG